MRIGGLRPIVGAPHTLQANSDRVRLCGNLRVRKTARIRPTRVMMRFLLLMSSSRMESVLLESVPHSYANYQHFI
jgi:hypothetical protein